ncbi:MAG TPA: PLP-dependent aminotransferase family protein [Mycobacteriales bacterium]|nr:PLP-dependent aminotransferase family protein [Mycobacteriales bacterium]
MKYPAADVARMLVETGARNGPLHSQLSHGLRELIDLGELPPDAILPSERSLADALTVSRTTVVSAYAALQAEGRLERRQGSGTRVCAPTAATRETVSAGILAGDHVSAQYLNGPLATIDFSTAALPMAACVADVATQITRDTYLALGEHHHGYHPRGLIELRQRIADYYTAAGLPTSAEQILITSGAQQALELVAHGCLERGDAVITEEPTYRGALDAFARAGARMHAVPCDEHSTDVTALERLTTAHVPRLIYVQSTVHNPTGAVLPASRRGTLVHIAEQHRSILVDDTSLAETAFSKKRPLPLAAHTRSDRIITIGSLSKLFWGGLRIGWIRGARKVVARLAQMKGLSDLGTSLVSQQIGLGLFDLIEATARTRRSELTAGLATLTELLEQALPSWSWQEPQGGASLWVRLPSGDATGLAQVALRYGVAILPGAVFSATGTTDDHLRLPYSLRRSVLTAGVSRLAQAWEAYTQHGVRAVPTESVRT